jgi:outer membrane receptor protein involved in Fe transport
MTNERQTGSVYATVGQSFKAPTMDQLFDQRRTPVPFPPFAISTSNSTLEAQYGKTAEVGAYHQVRLVPNQLDARVSVSAYQTDMRNELDFDLENFRYVNLGKSRHRGLETAVNLQGPSSLTAFANLALQRVTSRAGEDSGKQLKAIPRRVVSAGVGRTSATGLSVSFSASNVGETFLDDANTLTLPGHTQVDARLSYPLGRARLSVDARNLFGARFNSTGFPDPAGSPLIYYFPAARRVLTVGVESGW